MTNTNTPNDLFTGKILHKIDKLAKACCKEYECNAFVDTQTEGNQMTIIIKLERDYAIN
jgi:hypothetical protein